MKKKIKYESLDDKIYNYYDKISNPKYIVGDWIIADDSIYKKNNKKLTFLNLLSHQISPNGEYLVVGEDKNKYYAIKYNDKFICIKVTDTEYGLYTGEYNLLAVNKKILSLKKINGETLPFKDICDLFGWKLNKKAIDILEFFS
jgi:hypothetical protein